MLVFHDAAAIFELLEGDEFKALVENIREHGLLTPIWLHPDGSILDGRNRYRACLEAKVEPVFQTWDGDGFVTDFVHSLNYARRHLEGNAKALAAGRYAVAREAEAKERQLSGLKHVKSSSGSIEHNDESGRSSAITAKNTGVKQATVRRAATVIKHAIPEVIEAVARNEVSISAAAVVADLPDPQQRELVEEGPEAVTEYARLSREPEPVDPDGFVASMLNYHGARDGLRSAIKPLIRKALENVAGESVGSERDDAARDLGTALDLLEADFGDVIDGFDEDQIAEIVEKA